MKNIFITIALLLFFTVNINASVEDTVVILFNSDSYGILQPCSSCPSAGGGVAPQIYLRDSLNILYQDRFINLQGGGFTAGGEFDRYKEITEELDSLETVYKLRSFPAMGYDAVGVGHEDYKYRNLFETEQKKFNIPAVSLNVLNKDSSYLYKPYQIIERLGKRFAVTSIVGRSDYIERDHIYVPPFELLDDFISEFKDKADGIIILNYCGDDSIQKVTKAVNEAGAQNKTVIFNSYIKRFESRNYLYELDSVAVINFNFHAQASIIATGVFGKDYFTVSRVSLYGLTHRAPVSQKGTKLVGEFENEKKALLSGNRKINIDMFISRTCPYCKMALDDFKPIFDDENVKINLFETAFSQGDDYKISHFLIGQFFDREKFFEKVVQMQNLYHPSADIDSLIALIDEDELEEYYKRRDYLMKNNDIFAVPDIYINNTRLKDTDLRNLMGYVCRNFKYSNIEYCQDGPECFSAFDCPYVPGMSVSCSGDGECIYSSEIPKMYVIYDENAVVGYDADVVTQTRQKVASLEVEYIRFESLDKHSEKLEPYTGMLPIYFVNGNAYNSQGLKEVHNFFEQKGRYYKLTEEMTTPNVINSREYIEGDLKVFISLFHALSNSKEIVDDIVEKYASGEIYLGFLLRKDRDDNLNAFGPKRELEQIERIRAVEIIYPDKKGDYIKNWLKDPFSDNWQKPLEESGIDPYKIYTAITKKQLDLKLQEDFEVFENVPPKFYINLLVNNREIYDVINIDVIDNIKQKLK